MLKRVLQDVLEFLVEAFFVKLREAFQGNAEVDPLLFAPRRTDLRSGKIPALNERLHGGAGERQNLGDFTYLEQGW